MAYIPTQISYLLPEKHNLPCNTATWTAAPSRAVLLLHDMQNFFLKPFERSMKMDLISNVSALLRWAKQMKIQIAYSAQPGGMTETQRGLLKDFWGPGMEVSDTDRAIPAEILPSDKDWLLTKWRYSAFFQSDLLALMRKSKRDQLIITGVYGHIGILMTALESYTNDIETFIIADAIADFSLEDHNMMLNYAAKRCAVITSVGDIIA